MRVVLALVVAAGCSKHIPNEPPWGDAASATSIQLACESHGTTFPPQEKKCVAATDCYVANHMINCCGTMVAIGLNAADTQGEFPYLEGKCEAAYPACGCASLPTAAEDGRTSADGTIMVECTSGLCATYVP